MQEKSNPKVHLVVVSEGKKVVVHSDGAKRMKFASEKFMNVTYAMDEFHIVKHIKSLCSGEIG